MTDITPNPSQQIENQTLTLNCIRSYAKHYWSKRLSELTVTQRRICVDVMFDRFIPAAEIAEFFHRDVSVIYKDLEVMKVARYFGNIGCLKRHLIQYIKKENAKYRKSMM